LIVGLGVLIVGGGLAVWEPWTKAPAPRAEETTDTQPSAKATKPVPIGQAESRSAPPKPKETAKLNEPPRPEVPLNSEADVRRIPEEDTPFRRGQEQMKVGDYQGAIQSFTQAISLHSRNARAFASRGSAHQRLEQNEAAVRDYSEAIRLAPGEAFAFAGRGVCLVRLHRDDDAFADFSRALDLEPGLASALNGRGGVYFRRRQNALALRDYNAAIIANPRFAQAYQNRARARQSMGDAAGAAADLQMEERLRSQEKN
jgi:tetratricopeptide (TPR) repeat protein